METPSGIGIKMNRLAFIKMEGAGNDFIVIDNREQAIRLDDVIKRASDWCNRRTGIGADGILLLEKASLSGTDYSMTYRNADGSDAGMCGNGSRCLALLAHELGLGNELIFSVHQNLYKAVVHPDGVTVSVSFPPIAAPTSHEFFSEELVQVYTGTEHVVQFVEDKILKNDSFLRKKGKEIRFSSDFNPLGTNVNFACITNENAIQLETYERGVENLTLACGTGAIATAIAAYHKTNRVDTNAQYNIITRGGQMEVAFSKQPDAIVYKDVILRGPARFVFEGEIDV